MISIGIDPGKSGAVVMIDSDGAVEWIKADRTLHDIYDWIFDELNVRKDEDCRCVVEQVQAMPKSMCGNVPMFKLGQSFGQLEAFIVAMHLPYKLVRPAKWQQVMSCRTKGDKNVSKAAAQRLFPDVKVTHAIADALLLAEMARTKWETV